MKKNVKKKQCIVPLCDSHLKGTMFSMHRFPNDNQFKQEWIKAITTPFWVPNITPGSKICSSHFEPKYKKMLGQKIFLTEDAIPSTKKVAMRMKNESSPQLYTSQNFLSSSSSSTLASITATPNVMQKLKNKYQNKNKTPMKVRILCKDKLNNLRFVQQGYSSNKRKIESFQSLLEELEEKNFISSDISELLTTSYSFTKELFEQHSIECHKEIIPKQYSTKLRSFASTLNFFSPKGYEYVRQVFNLSLPHPKIISNWSTSIDGSPGFTKEAFQALKNISYNSYKSRKQFLLCSLVIDEIAIRRNVEWDGKMNHGYINFGNNIIEDTTEVAKEALIFMVVAVNASWRLPVAYFLTNSLNGQQKATLVRDCINKVEECNVKVISLTVDGTSSNIAMSRILVNNLENEIEDKFFTVNNYKIRIFHDPCHMMKLIINTLIDKKMLFRDNGDVIKWAYFQELNKLQEKERIHLGNKIKNLYLNYEKQKMRVKLGGHVFSESVAESLEFCLNELKLTQFEGSEATIVFLRHMNNCFNILSSRKISGFNSKKAMSEQNFKDISDYIGAVVQYIRSIKFENRKIGFEELITDLRNSCELYKDYVATGLLKFFPTYKLSQDHIDLFFSSIRLGNNDNPTARQFKTAYSRLVEIMNDIDNCVPQENIFKWSCGSAIAQINNSSKNNFNLLFTNINNEENIEDFEPLSKSFPHITTTIAGFVMYKLKNKLNCPLCISALSAKENDFDFEHSLICYKNKRGFFFPSKDLMKICKYCEFLFKQIVNFNDQNLISKLTSQTIMNFLGDNIFVSLNEHILEQEPSDNHFGLLLKSICEIYFNTRIHYQMKTENKETNIRNLIKFIHFKEK